MTLSTKIVFRLFGASFDLSCCENRVLSFDVEARESHRFDGLMMVTPALFCAASPGLTSTYFDMRYCTSDGIVFISSTTAAWGMVSKAAWTSTLVK